MTMTPQARAVYLEDEIWPTLAGYHARGIQAFGTEKAVEVLDHLYPDGWGSPPP